MSALSYAGINETVIEVTGERQRTPDGPMRIGKLDRRQFMKLTGLLGGGLMLSFTLPRASAAGGPLQPNGYVRIDATGILLFAKNPEVGPRRENLLADDRRRRTRRRLEGRHG